MGWKLPAAPPTIPYPDMPTDELLLKGKQAAHVLKHARFTEISQIVEELTKRLGKGCDARIKELEEEIEGWRRNYA